MKSTIKIALGQANEPIINFNIVPSDDLRDQLCQQFKERLGYSSNLAFVEFSRFPLTGSPTEGTVNLTIHPIHPDEQDRYINRLCIGQCATIIPLAFQVLSNEDARDVLKQCPFQTESTDGLPSKYQINSPVSTEDIFDGQIVAVRFTVGKVYYDILDKLTGKIMRDVDSCAVSSERLPVAN